MKEVVKLEVAAIAGRSTSRYLFTKSLYTPGDDASANPTGSPPAKPGLAEETT